MPEILSSTIGAGDITIPLPIDSGHLISQSNTQSIDPHLKQPDLSLVSQSNNPSNSPSNSQSIHRINNMSNVSTNHPSGNQANNHTVSQSNSTNSSHPGTQPASHPSNNHPSDQLLNDFFPEVELSNTARMMSATIGALITSFVVTPFDVVKTRLQAQVTVTNQSINQSLNQVFHRDHKHSSCANPRTSFSNKSINQTGNPSTPLKHVFAQLNHAANNHSSNNRSINQSVYQSTNQMLDQCSHVRLQTGFVDTWCHKCTIIAPRPSTNQLLPAYMAYPLEQSINQSFNQSMSRTVNPANNQMVFTGTFDCLVKLIKNEGVGSLWRGLSPQLLLSIPSTVVYFGAYDRLKGLISQTINQSYNQPIKSNKPDYHLNSPSTNQPATSPLNHFVPLLAGTSARALTTILVSPIELIRTKAQSINQSVRMRDLIKFEIQKGGVTSLWRGANPTLWRDVPFSAIYWSTYESIKESEMPKVYKRIKHHQANHPSDNPSHNQSIYQYELMKSSFFAGAFSGILSATLTHPFDLVKTRRQIEMYQMIDQSMDQSINQTNKQTIKKSNNKSNNQSTKQSNKSNKSLAPSLPKHNVHTTFDVLKLIIREEGYLGLTTGIGARVSKIAPACAIMISSYEVAKAKFGHIKQSNNQTIIDKSNSIVLNELK